MRLDLFKSLWGVVRADGGRRSVAEVVATLPGEGYTGVECSLKLAHDCTHEEGLLQLLQEQGLSWIPILFSSGPVNGWSPAVPNAPVAASDAAPTEHVAAIGRQLEAAQQLASSHGVAIPFFNLHSGHDSFREADSLEYLQGCARLAQDLGVRLVHEIHRGRIFNNPWATARLAAQEPHVELIADYSHFAAACEVEPWDPMLLAVLQKLTPHIGHLHARVGYENGPQVPDPRCPHWQRHTSAFERCWADIWRHQLLTPSRGGRPPAVTTATPEYGPPTYQHVLPSRLSMRGQGGQEPLQQGVMLPTADIDAVNDWTRQRLLELFAEVTAGTGPR